VISGEAINSKNAAPADGATFSFDSRLRACPASVTPGHMRRRCIPVPSAGMGFLRAYTCAKNPVASREVELGRDGLALSALHHRRIA
jgi:hypothetical protein